MSFAFMYEVPICFHMYKVCPGYGTNFVLSKIVVCFGFLQKQNISQGFKMYQVFCLTGAGRNHRRVEGEYQIVHVDCISVFISDK